MAFSFSHFSMTSTFSAEELQTAQHIGSGMSMVAAGLFLFAVLATLFGGIKGWSFPRCFFTCLIAALLGGLIQDFFILEVLTMYRPGISSELQGGFGDQPCTFPAVFSVFFNVPVLFGIGRLIRYIRKRWFRISTAHPLS